MFETNKHSSDITDQKTSNSGKDYVRTTDEQKLELIDLVINEKYSMKLASEIVGVKLSTVKYIVKAYKTDKEYFMDKLKPKKNRLQKGKKKQEPKNMAHFISDPDPNIQEQMEHNVNEANTSKIDVEINNSLDQTYIQNFPLFQHYFQFISQWNNLFPYSNDWMLNYQES